MELKVSQTYQVDGEEAERASNQTSSSTQSVHNVSANDGPDDSNSIETTSEPILLGFAVSRLTQKHRRIRCDSLVSPSKPTRTPIALREEF